MDLWANKHISHFEVRSPDIRYHISFCREIYWLTISHLTSYCHVGSLGKQCHVCYLIIHLRSDPWADNVMMKSLGRQCHISWCVNFGGRQSRIPHQIFVLWWDMMLDTKNKYLWASNSTCPILDLILREDFWADNVISHISCWDEISGQTHSYLTFYFDVRSWQAMSHLISHPMSA